MDAPDDPDAAPDVPELHLPASHGNPYLHFRCPLQPGGGMVMVPLMVSWFWQSLHGSSAQVAWISHFQLYSDFILSTGHPGPVHRGKRMSGDKVPQLQLQGYGFKQRTRWFVKVLKEIIRHQSVPLPYGYGRPKSHSILAAPLRCHGPLTV